MIETQVRRAMKSSSSSDLVVARGNNTSGLRFGRRTVTDLDSKRILTGDGDLVSYLRRIRSKDPWRPIISWSGSSAFQHELSHRILHDRLASPALGDLSELALQRLQLLWVERRCQRVVAPRQQIQSV